MYIGGNAVTDPDEIARRTEEFQQRAFYYYAELGKAVCAMEAEDDRADPGRQGPAQARSCRSSSRSSTCTPAAASPPITTCCDTYQKTLEGYFRMWHHHFEFLLLGYGAYLTFFDFCKKAFPEISDQTVARMVAGMDAEIFRPDDELRRLAKCAIDFGVDAQFRDGTLAG